MLFIQLIQWQRGNSHLRTVTCFWFVLPSHPPRMTHLPSVTPVSPPRTLTHKNCQQDNHILLSWFLLRAKGENLSKISRLLDSSTLYPSRVVYHSTVTLRGALGVTVRYCTTLGGGQGRMNQKYWTSNRFQVTALPMKEPTKQDMVMLLVLLVALGF